MVMHSKLSQLLKIAAGANPLRTQYSYRHLIIVLPPYIHPRRGTIIIHPQ
jgi:hypothetical protein